MKDKTVEYTFDGIYVGSDLVSVDVTVNWSWDDVGIGSYEFWGEIGYDSNYIYQPDEYFINSITIYYADDEDGNGVELINTPENRKYNGAYFDAAEKRIESELAEMEPPDLDEDTSYDSDR